MTEEEKNRKLQKLPQAPGVYIMRDSAARIIYIGKAKNLRKRVSSYFRPDSDLKVKAIIRALRHIDFILASSESEALVLERDLINRYKPYYNVMWRDDKSYPSLKLTLKEDFPRLLITRRVVDDGSEYYGPYPQAGHLKSVLRWFQKVFRWRFCRLEFSASSLPPEHKVKSCLYLQTGRCPGPCVGAISVEDYRKSINELRLFLKGRYRSLIDAWETEMREASRDLDFERAAELRDRIRSISTFDEKVTVRELQPEDMTASLRATQAIEELKEKAGLAKWPIVIEGFDISNTSGTEPVASMVRFHNGKPDKDNYRRFRIKTVTGIDDPAMIGEAVYRRYRRLKEEGKEMPDLILIDGGKIQLAAAAASLASLRLKVTVLSLAKRDEEIHQPGKTGPLKLDAHSSALQLLQAVRDEAHRFAHAFHTLRRKKRMGL